MKKLTVLIGLLFILSHCGKNKMLSYNDLLNDSGAFGDINYSTEVTPLGETESQVGDEIWTCVSEHISIQDALGGDNGFSLFSPNANVVYPGNLIQGASLYKASPDEILADRAGGDITISILDGNDVSSVYVDEISLGSVTTAANQILAGKDENSVIPANFQFNKSIIQSEEEFAYKIKADYTNAWGSVSGRLSFSSNTTYSRMMVTLDQTFYTLSFSAPTKPEDFFHEDADPEDLERFTGPGNPPCYLSSVNYGRIFYMLIESSSSEAELKTAVEGSFETLTQSGGGEFESDYFESIEEVNIKIFALGGDAAVTIEAGGLTKNNLGDLTEILQRSTDIRAAVPVSYKVQSVKTNQVVAVQLATDYERKTCLVTSALPAPPATAHWTGVYDLLGGPICAMVRLDAVEVFDNADLPMMFVDSTGYRCVLDYQGILSGPYDHPLDLIQQNNLGTLNEFPLVGIGAGGTFMMPDGNGGTYKEHIWINKLGNRHMSGWLTGNNPTVNTGLVGNYELISHFETEGISAICDYFPFGTITINTAGTRQFLDPYIDIATSEEGSTNIFTGGPDSNKFPEGIGAITRLDDLVFATVDKAGRRYMVVDWEDSDNIKYFGPFKL